MGWTLPGPSLKHVRSSLGSQQVPFGRSLSVKPTEVGQFQFSALIDQQVLWLQVAVEDFPPMAVGQTAKQLEQKQLQGGRSRKEGVKIQGGKNSTPPGDLGEDPQRRRLGIRRKLNGSDSSLIYDCLITVVMATERTEAERGVLTLTLWTLMRFPQSSRYCFRSLSWNKSHHQFKSKITLCVCVW